MKVSEGELSEHGILKGHVACRCEGRSMIYRFCPRTSSRSIELPDTSSHKQQGMVLAISSSTFNFYALQKFRISEARGERAGGNYERPSKFPSRRFETFESHTR